MPLPKPKSTQLKIHWLRNVDTGLVACGACCLTVRQLHNHSLLYLEKNVTCKKCLLLIGKAMAEGLKATTNRYEEEWRKKGIKFPTCS